jgi:hypothetical protein
MAELKDYESDAKAKRRRKEKYLRGLRDSGEQRLTLLEDLREIVPKNDW